MNVLAEPENVTLLPEPAFSVTKAMLALLAPLTPPTVMFPVFAPPIFRLVAVMSDSSVPLSVMPPVPVPTTTPLAAHQWPSAG